MTILQNHAETRGVAAERPGARGRHHGGLDARLAAGSAWEIRRRRLRALAARYEVGDDDRRLDRLAKATTRLVGSVLELFGWHRHARGAYRKRKGPIAVKQEAMPGAAEQAAADLDLRMTIRRAVVPAQRTGNGYFGIDYMNELRAKARASLDALIDKARSNRPAASRLLAQADRATYGRELAIAYRLEPLDERIEAAILARLEPGDLLRREAIVRRVGQVRAALAGRKPPTPVEQLIIERVSICWLAVQECELAVLGPARGAPDEAAERRLERANRRLCDVLKALDNVRRKVPAHHLARIRLEVDPPAPAEAPPPAIDVTPDPSN